jgi:hypothetical protein
MLDHYSEIPAPSLEEATNEVVEFVKKQHFTFKLDELFTTDELSKICKESVEEVGPLGSMSGWWVFTSKKACTNAMDKILNTCKHKTIAAATEEGC